MDLQKTLVLNASQLEDLLDGLSLLIDQSETSYETAHGRSFNAYDLGFLDSTSTPEEREDAEKLDRLWALRGDVYEAWVDTQI